MPNPLPECFDTRRPSSFLLSVGHTEIANSTSADHPQSPPFSRFSKREQYVKRFPYRRRRSPDQTAVPRAAASRLALSDAPPTAVSTSPRITGGSLRRYGCRLRRPASKTRLGRNGG